MRTIVHSYGNEFIIGTGDKVVRIYTNSSKNSITIDLSQVRDKTWDKYVKTIAKYGHSKIKITGSNDHVITICDWFKS